MQRALKHPLERGVSLVLCKKSLCAKDSYHSDTDLRLQTVGAGSYSSLTYEPLLIDMLADRFHAGAGQRFGQPLHLLSCMPTHDTLLHNHQRFLYPYRLRF